MWFFGDSMPFFVPENSWKKKPKTKCYAYLGNAFLFTSQSLTKW